MTSNQIESNEDNLHNFAIQATRVDQIFVRLRQFFLHFILQESHWLQIHNRQLVLISGWIKFAFGDPLNHELMSSTKLHTLRDKLLCLMNVWQRRLQHFAGSLAMHIINETNVCVCVCVWSCDWISSFESIGFACVRISHFRFVSKALTLTRFFFPTSADGFASTYSDNRKSFVESKLFRSCQDAIVIQRTIINVRNAIILGRILDSNWLEINELRHCDDKAKNRNKNARTKEWIESNSSVFSVDGIRNWMLKRVYNWHRQVISSTTISVRGSINRLNLQQFAFT